MASGIFAILDDVAMLLDDAAVMSKVAAKKTAGLLGDDLAVNAEKATGFHASRELPVIWAITRGSFVNKLIILPVAFLVSAYLPWLIVPVLLLGAWNHGHNPFIDHDTDDDRDKQGVSTVAQITEAMDALRAAGGNLLRCVLDPGMAAGVQGFDFCAQGGIFCVGLG